MLTPEGITAYTVTSAYTDSSAYDTPAPEDPSAREHTPAPKDTSDYSYTSAYMDMPAPEAPRASKDPSAPEVPPAPQDTSDYSYTSAYMDMPAPEAPQAAKDPSAPEYALAYFDTSVCTDMPAQEGPPAPECASAYTDMPAPRDTSARGDKDEYEAAAGLSQELEASTQALQPSPSLQERDSRQGSVSPDAQAKEETCTGSVPDGAPGSATPDAEALSPQNAEAQPAGGTGDTDRQLATQAAGSPGEKTTPPCAEPQGVPEGTLQAQSPPPSPRASAPGSPAFPMVALDRRPMDSSLDLDNEEIDYMRSVTSLLGGGEGAISSLADILVWSESGMGMATGFLASGHSHVTDLLHRTGPSLRSVSSILAHASSAFSSRLVGRTGSALHSVTHMLEAVERRMVEGIRSAVRYLTSRLTPRRARASPNGD
ncbi:PREDICTED: uncharacterized protein C2orf57 homolog [Condylura cristata]|uniref:uncharacterized protein C2orf57 homolog n=1 Tax=Condylura cristata TaxID=143302 RepID=UPI0003344420|nr:PREDICTED: uncharacterized protein C2orf57 homolog [Condylura cristata]